MNKKNKTKDKKCEKPISYKRTNHCKCNLFNRLKNKFDF